MIKTEAWLLYPKISSDKQQTAELIQETISFSEPTGEEVLVEPLYGCWEGNMTHAVNRSPIDICRERGEDKVVIGNAGVVRVLRSNALAPTLKEGDHCWIFSSAEQDRLGYMTNALAYDACNTMGLLAKTSKIPARCLVKIPTSSRYSLKQWATFLSVMSLHGLTGKSPIIPGEFKPPLKIALALSSLPGEEASRWQNYC